MEMSLMMLKLSREGIPTPFPTVGIPGSFKPACIYKRFAVVRVVVSTPDFGRFVARAALSLTVMPRFAKTSLTPIAHARKTGLRREQVKDTRP